MGVDRVVAFVDRLRCRSGNPSYLNGLVQQAQELRGVKQRILHETGLSRYLPFSRGLAQLPQLLDREIELYGALRDGFVQKEEEFTMCRQELEAHYFHIGSRLEQLAELPVAPVVISAVPGPDETASSSQMKLRVQTQNQLRAIRTDELDRLYELRHRHEMTRSYESKRSDVNALLDIVILLQRRFGQTAHRLEREQESLQAEVRTFKNLIELKPMSAVLREIGQGIRRVTNETYDAVQRGLSDIEHALSGVTIPPFAADAPRREQKIRYSW